MVNRSPSTAAGIVFFDDEKGLQRCLSSIQSFVDLIIAIDGKFKYFEDIMILALIIQERL